MNTKEAIRYINGFNVTCNEERKNNLKQVETLLQYGEKYEKAWGKLYEDYGEETLKMNLEEKLSFIMDSLKQKCFPKPTNRWKRINDIVENLNTIGGSVDIKKLVSLLIELRDEELKEED